jgi:exodeoxyribonuclease V gamma subunit
MRTDIQTGLLALHGNRSEALAEAVLTWLRQRPLAPLEEEVILVQSAGMAEWLKMTLARDGGVCAAMRVELPARFMWRTYRQVLGRDQVPSQCATDKAPLTWRLMQLLPQWMGTPGFEPIAGFLQGDEPDRLYQLASRLADLFDQYQVYRADWLEAWAEGRDELVTPGRAPQPVPAEQRWQPMLWRTLLASLNPSDLQSIRPRVQQRVLHALEQGVPLDSPVARRVVVFGMTSVPLPTLQLLATLSEHSQVLMAIPNPCRFHWADIMDGRELLRGIARRRHALRGDVDLSRLSLDQMHAHAHPLLAAWGRQSRDFVRQLDEFDDVQQAQARFAVPRVDLFDDGDDGHAPLLVQVQQRIRDLVPMQEHPKCEVPASDRSIVFHVAHSMMREVEVLHDQLLQLFADTAGTASPVQPRDVVVMVPDIDLVASAIRAVFEQYGRHDARFMPFDIADLSARASNPLVSALEWLLRLPQQRCRISELRDLLDVPAVAARFGISTDALPRLTQWMAGAGIRWGLDETHRENLGLAACGDQNTGWFGLRRMLLGYAAGQGEFDGIEAYAEVGGLEAELAGALANLLARLSHWREVLSEPATPLVWAERGRALLSDLVKAQDDQDRLILTALDDALRAWLDACALASFDAPVDLHVAREAWLSALNEPAVNKRFKAGGVTFCTLMPMRAIPFEVVCLLGMNDGDYPRRATRTDFDLMLQAGTNRAGDRSRRDDDRQLMLEALLSARRQLYVSWTGRSVRDNTEQPPSVLVSQLRDYLAAGWAGEVLEARTTEHPLQPFSRRYFELGSALFTHAREWHAAHGDAVDETCGAAAEASSSPPLPPFEPDPHVPVTLAQLAQFLRHPAQVFFRQRLNVVFHALDAEPEDEESFGLDALEEHQLVSSLMDEVLADLDARLQTQEGVTDAQAQWDALREQVKARMDRLRRSGRLPMGALGVWTQQTLEHTLLPMLAAWQREVARYSHVAARRAVRVAHNGVVLQDWLDHLRLSDEADALPTWLDLSPGKLAKSKQTKKDAAQPKLDKLRLTWVRSVVAACEGQAVQGVLVGSDATVLCTPMDPAVAHDDLQALLKVWRAGLDAPLPLPMRTALAKVTESEDPEAVYEGGFMRDAECDDPCWSRLYPDFDALSADGRFEVLTDEVWGRVQTWATNHVMVTMHEAVTDEVVAQDEAAMPTAVEVKA